MSWIAAATQHTTTRLGRRLRTTTSARRQTTNAPPAAARNTTPGRSLDSGRPGGSGEPDADAATTVRPSKPTSARPIPAGGTRSREAVTAAIIAAAEVLLPRAS